MNIPRHVFAGENAQAETAEGERSGAQFPHPFPPAVLPGRSP
jgi:hypothetical protein